VLKGNPKEASTQLRKLAGYYKEKIKFEREKTYGILVALARKIDTISPRVWGALIKFFDLSFDNPVGSAMLSGFLNVKNLGSNQKLLDYFETQIKKNSQPVIPKTGPQEIWWDDLKAKKDFEKREEEEKAKERNTICVRETYWLLGQACGDLEFPSGDSFPCHCLYNLPGDDLEEISIFLQPGSVKVQQHGFSSHCHERSFWRS